MKRQTELVFAAQYCRVLEEAGAGWCWMLLGNVAGGVRWEIFMPAGVECLLVFL